MKLKFQIRRIEHRKPPLMMTYTVHASVGKGSKRAKAIAKYLSQVELPDELLEKAQGEK